MTAQIIELNPRKSPRLPSAACAVESLPVLSRALTQMVWRGLDHSHTYGSTMDTLHGIAWGLLAAGKLHAYNEVIFLVAIAYQRNEARKNYVAE